MGDLYIFLDHVVTLIINPLIGLLMAAALAYFIWGLAEFILNADDPEAQKGGKAKIIWGIVGLLIMVSVFGILRVTLSTFCTTTTGPGGEITCAN